MLDFITKLFGDPNERKISKLAPLVDEINDFESQMEALSDEELQAKTLFFKNELANRERDEDPEKDKKLEQAVLDLLLPEAFAVVREAGKRVLGMRHYDVQLIGGYVLHKGGIAEMRTGEGKTLVATLPAYLNALTGKGVHIVTVNDYLAKRDAEWMGMLYRFLGLSVGMVLSEQRGFGSFLEKREAYKADITFGTNNEFGFDYLRDNMATSPTQMVQRPFNFAIIDEVDSILIDEARTPLIISGRLQRSAETYTTMAKMAPILQKETDYTVDEKARNVILTEEGIDKAQEMLGLDDLFDPKTNLAHHLLCALKAKELFKVDTDYVVNNGEVVIVDEFTGRLMEGRRWSDGLHQAVEAKEGVDIQDETQTLASITFQNLFRLYPKLSGMTGTALTEEAEFGKIYSLTCTAIPTNKPDIRKDKADQIFKSEAVKFFKVAESIVRAHQEGRPTLVGTTSIEKSEALSTLLTRPEAAEKHFYDKLGRFIKYLEETNRQEQIDLLRQKTANLNQLSLDAFENLPEENEGFSKSDLPDWIENLTETLRLLKAVQQGVPHHVLNAKHHEQEAVIVAQAGRPGGVTIATNMAGRGTDILLGGNPEFLARDHVAQEGRDWRSLEESEWQAMVGQFKQQTEADKQKVLDLGGLHIIGTERHESRRIDNQLRGRAGRQGDPGSTQFFLSLQDPLMRLFAGAKVAGLMELMNFEETIPISNPIINKQLDAAQRKVEAHHFDIRKNILQYDDVLTEQRQLIYEQRKKVLHLEELRSSVGHMVQQEMKRTITNHITPDFSAEDAEQETLEEILRAVHNKIPQLQEVVTLETLSGKSYPQLISFLEESGKKAYSSLEDQLERISGQLREEHGIRLSGLDAEEEATLTEKALSPEELMERRHPLRKVERDIILSVVDAKWIDYLHNLDSLREGIGLRAYGQKDPLIEYKREAYDMFQALTYQIQQEVVMLLFRSRIEIQLERQMSEEELAQLAASEGDSESGNGDPESSFV